MTPRIVLVTDDPPRLASLAATLGAAGFDVVVLPPEQEAFRSADSDLVLVDPAGAPGTLDIAERRHIAATLRRTGGNKRQAAHLLGIARSTLLAKIRKYGLDRIGHDPAEPASELAS